MANELKELLRQADEQSPRSKIDPSKLADSVLRTAKLQQRRRRVAAGIGVAAITVSVGITLLASLNRSTAPHRELASSMVNRRAEDSADKLRALDHRIHQQEQMIQRLVQAERLATQQQRLDDLLARPIPDPDAPIERAASAIVFQANQTYQTTHQPGPALQAYQDVITHFPSTASARLARRRVEELKNQG